MPGTKWQPADSVGQRAIRSALGMYQLLKLLRTLLLPDKRKHRGPHPEDEELFSVAMEPTLRSATSELSWLLTRGYAPTASLKLVGDRYNLDARQRLAVARCACSDPSATRRRDHEVTRQQLKGQELWVDGYNVLTSVEAALSGAVILHARDGSYRDMASMHGSYRKVEETVPAIEILGELLSRCEVTMCRWFLDEPVSNSGRLKSLLRELSDKHAWDFKVELVRDPDSVLMAADQVVASADSHILDHTLRWFNLARAAIESRVADAWILNLSK